MLTRCRGTIGMDKLNTSFKSANISIELLQKIGDQNKIIGILMCLRYFKSMINHYFKITSKKKKLESLIDLNKLNDKLDLLSQKMQSLEKSLPFILGTKNFTKSPTYGSNTDAISYSVCAQHAESVYDL
jgi:hypothetical protein